MIITGMEHIRVYILFLSGLPCGIPKKAVPQDCLKCFIKSLCMFRFRPRNCLPLLPLLPGLSRSLLFHG